MRNQSLHAPSRYLMSRRGRILTFISTLMLGTVMGGLTANAQQTVPAGQERRFDGTLVPLQPEGLFQPGEVLVQMAPGVTVQELIQSFIDGTDDPNVAPSARRMTPGSQVVTVTFNGTGQTTEDSIQKMLTETDAETAALPDTKFIETLRGSPKVLAVSRNYIFHATANSLNDTISGAGATEDAINDIIEGGTGETKSPAKDKQGGDPVFPNDSRFDVQWHLKSYGTAHDAKTSPGAVNFPTVWSTNKGSKDVVVAVIDSGIVSQHPDIDFAGRILSGYDFVGADMESANDGTPGYDNDPTEPAVSAITKPCTTQDAGWHGTHVAGIAGAVKTNNGDGIAGGAWNIKILPVRAISKCNSGSLQDIRYAIYWAAGFKINGIPDNPNPATIINMSLGGSSPRGCSPFYQEAIDAVHAQGVTVIVSAGNAGSDAALFSPANCKNVITVAASDARGHLTNYSNFGNGIDILAPGGDNRRDDNQDGQPDGILSTIEGDYSFYEGTSMASPLVAAAAALMKSEDPSLNPDQIRKRLRDTATKRTVIECAKSCGAGLLNVSGQ